MNIMKRAKFADFFGNPLLVPDGVTYAGYIVGDGRSRVFCPSDVSHEEAEQFYQDACLLDSSLSDEPVCLVMSG